ncbi:pectinesterase family protein [Streptomyces globisporus]|uniref:pectinesterase family protein n=1 Tax=Streptomyces globisporus TaxID=1908 RepID=UPI003460984A
MPTRRTALSLIAGTGATLALGAPAALARSAAGPRPFGRYGSPARRHDPGTLYVDAPSLAVFARQYYRDCYVEGDVDFVFGRASAVYDRCHFRTLTRPGLAAAPHGFVFAPSTAGADPYGYLVLCSRVTSTAPDGYYKLARPWVPSSDPTARPMLTVRDSRIGAGIDASAPYATMSAGHPWQDQRFAEHRNTGPGARITVPANRPQLSASEARAHTPARWLGDWRPLG